MKRSVLIKGATQRCQVGGKPRPDTTGKARYGLYLLIMLAMVAPPAASQDSQLSTAPPDDEGSGGITISISGADVVSKDIAASLQQLATALEDIRKSGIELPADEIERLNSLLVNLNTLTQTAGDSAPKFSKAIVESEATIIRVSEEVVSKVGATIVDPSIGRIEELVAKIQEIVRDTRIIAVFSGMFLLVAVVAILIWLRRQLSFVFDQLGKISGAYILVPREEWEARSGASLPLQTQPSDSSA